MSDWNTVAELFNAGSRNLAPDTLAYLESGVGAEVTLRRNREAFSRWAIVAQYLRGVREPRLTTSFLGRELRAPLMLAPVGTLGDMADDGHRAAIAAAADTGIAVCSNILQSPNATLAVDENSVDAVRLLQIYAGDDTGYILDLAERAAAAGWHGLVLTVDTPARQPLRRIARVDRSYSAQHRQNLATLTWDTVRAVVQRCPIPLLLKGIGTADDAERAVDAGVGGIYVSNHGGRSVDGLGSSLDMLSEVVPRIGDSSTVIVDGGVRDVTDIVTALALGADVVAFGRPYCLALAADGRSGLHELLDCWQHMLAATLIQLGVDDIEELDHRHLRGAQ